MKPVEKIIDLWQACDRRKRLQAGYLIVALLVIAVAWSALNSRVRQLEKKYHAREAVLQELLPLKVAYRAARSTSDSLKGRIASLRPDDSPGKLIEETGIKGKSVKIVPLKGEERGQFIEDAADVRIDGLTINEAINLLYRLEKGSRPLVMKKCAIRMRFDDPSRCDLTLVVALLKPAPGRKE